MKKVKPFNKPVHQAIFVALKNGDLNIFYSLAENEHTVDTPLPFEPIDILMFYQPDLAFLGELKSFLDSHQMISDPTLTYTDYETTDRRGYRIREFKNSFSQILYEGSYVLTAACDETGDVKSVTAYLDAGHDLHVYREEYVRGAIEEEFYSIAEMLIQAGCNLKKFPTIIQRILGWEFDKLVYEEIDCKNKNYDYSDKRVKFALEHGAWVNSYDEIGHTPLDRARKYGHKDAFELIRSYGGRYGFSLGQSKPDDWYDLTTKDGCYYLKEGTPYFGMRERAGEVK